MLRDADLCSQAARYGHLDVLKWLRSIDCQWDQYTAANAAEHGCIDVLEWARKNNANIRASAYMAACKAGQLEV